MATNISGTAAPNTRPSQCVSATLLMPQPVSYTHLDVYKRQVYEVIAVEDIVTPDGTVRAAAGDVVDTITTAEEAVSYTHLDVYKRQILMGH